MIADSTKPARRALVMNSLYTLVCGAPLLLLGDLLAEPLGVPSPGILRGFGAFLVVFAGLLQATARAARFPRALAVLLTVGDAAYVVASLAFAALDGNLVSALGRELVVLVALGTAFFVVIQAMALRSGHAPRLA